MGAAGRPAGIAQLISISRNRFAFAETSLAKFDAFGSKEDVNKLLLPTLIFRSIFLPAFKPSSLTRMSSRFML